MATHQIEKYDVSYYAGGSNSSNYTYRAIIGLRRDDGSLIGGAYFHRDPATMPPSDSDSGGSYIWLHYPADAFDRILDLLRNESPVFVRYVAGGWHLGAITTSLEPVGEGEAT